MGKLALCVPRSELLNNTPAEAWSLSLQDRDVVDNPTQLDPSIKQILPYITFVKDTGLPGYERYQLLCYLRGGSGDEARLRGAMSVGYGGHVDGYPQEPALVYEYLADEALREAKEEVGIDFPRNKMLAIVEDAIRNHKFILDESIPVNSVHMAIRVMYLLQQKELELFQQAVYEPGHIEQSQWISLKDLMSQEIFSRLEPWSKTTVEELVKPITKEMKEKGNT